MSTLKKLRGVRPGEKKSEVTRFKELWRDTLSEFSRDALRSLFLSSATQAQIRAEIAGKYGIKLTSDQQLNAFRDWELDQQERDLEADRMAEDERRTLAEHPQWTVEQARSDVLKKAMMRAGSRGDFKLGFQAIREQRAEELKLLDRDKFELLKRRAAQADETDHALTNAQMTPEQRAKRIAEIYGRG